jgi:hypothetical protein
MKKEFNAFEVFCILMFLVLFLSGCTSYNLEEDTPLVEEIDMIQGVNEYHGPLDGVMTWCRWKYYEIKYVDEIHTDMCYAMKREKLDDYNLRMLKESFQYAEHSPEEYFDFECMRMETLGSFWCLRDQSECLMLEDDGKICVVVKLE